MRPAREAIKTKMVRVRALNSKFLIGGKPAEPGQECTLDTGDAEMLVRAGKAQVVGEEPDRIAVSVRDLGDPPRAAVSWSR